MKESDGSGPMQVKAGEGPGPLTVQRAAIWRALYGEPNHEPRVLRK